MLEKFWDKCQNFSEAWNNWIIMFFVGAGLASHIAAVLGYKVGTAALLIGYSIIALELTKVLYRRRKKYALIRIAKAEDDEIIMIREREICSDEKKRVSLLFNKGSGG